MDNNNNNNNNNSDRPLIAGLSPEKHLLTKRKAVAENTPSGVDRLNQNPKVDVNINAGNIQSMHLNGISLTTMGDPPVPPVLERYNDFHSMCAPCYPPAVVTRSHTTPSKNNIASGEGNMSTYELYGEPWGSLDYDDGNVDTVDRTSFGTYELDVLNAFSGLDEITHEGNVQPNDDFHWISSEMKSDSFLPGYKLSKQYSSLMPLGEVVGSHLNLNTAEDHMMFGPSGILRSSMSMWNREKGRYGRGEQKNKHVLWERLEQFYCCGRNEGCDRQIILFRVDGGLVIFEKVDSNNNIIQHNKAAHNKQPSGAGEMALTIAQKMKVLDLRGKNTPIEIAKEIHLDPTIHCTNGQSSNLKEFARRITKWTSKKETKDKYFRLHWEHNVMNKDQQAAILNSLMKGGSQLSPTHHYFAGTTSYKDMVETIEVVQHDFNEGEDSSFVLFVAKDATERINLASQIFKEEDDVDSKQGAVQFHCDFTHLPGNKKTQLGIVVVEDIKHKAWPVSFIVSPPESIEWATAVMKVTVDLINTNPNAKLDKALVDGAAALKNAANSLGVTARSCFTHVARLPNGTKKNGKRGTKGSLCNYLSTGTKDGKEKPLSLKDSVKVRMSGLLDVHY